MSELRQVKASAGAGKTYQLTRRFLALLEGSDPDAVPFVCANRTGKGFAWPEIMAVTFTNKAAAEMKERVVSGLKEIALESGGHADVCSPETAGRTLGAILRRYHRLNIRTIDSLLALLLRLFALEFGVRPDFEIIFNQDELFETVFDHFVALCETSEVENDLLADALDTLIRSEGRSGFWVQDTVRKRLAELVQFLDTAPDSLLVDKDRIKDLLIAEFAEFKTAVDNMSAFLEDAGLPVGKHFLNFLDKCTAAEAFDPVPDSAMIQKESFRDCVNAKGKDSVDNVAEAHYARLQMAWTRYRSAHPLLTGAFYLAPAIEIAVRLDNGMEVLQRQQGTVLNAGVARRIAHLLDSDAVVSEAYCRLGCRLHHLLVDEFQDTSRDQWNAVTPLASECLAKGGSLYCVGDVKQAIYGWRGGDSTLFEGIAAQPELAPLAETVDAGSLPDNWRSFRNVVEFNNDFFSHLEDEELARELADDLFRSAPDDFRCEFARALATGFADCAQGVPDKHADTDGYVRMERIPGGRNSDVEDQALERLDGLMDDLVARRRYRDMGILVRSHSHAELVCDLLVRKNIPVITENSLQLDRHPVVRQLAGFLAFLDYPRDDLAFMTFIMGEEVFLAETGLDSADVLDWLTQAKRNPLGVRFRKDFPDQWQRYIEPFYNQSGLMTPYDLTREAIRVFRVLERHPESELYVRRFLEVVHLAEENGYTSLSNFLEYWAENSDQEKVPLPDNIDAVRIMTIHKSKGLEFPVVIVPFHHWKADNDKSYTLMDYRDHTLLAPLRKDMGRAYLESMGRVMREQLNLLYVAWTRAREELYGFFAEPSASTPAQVAINRFLDLDDNGIFERGSTPAETHPAAPTPRPVPQPLPEAEPVVGLMEWLPRLRVYRHNLEEYFFNERMRGEVAHRVMEHLLVTGRDADDAQRAIRLAMADFPALGSLPQDDLARLGSDLEAMTLWALSQPDLRAWLDRGVREPEVMDSDGEFKRFDLLCRDGGTVIVDFKTGRQDPKNHDQVREYMTIMRTMENVDPKGYLVYLDQREIVQVEAN
ncbi:UvrD-helicase domain-containing protein [Pseudodesulfovibrio portus]|uniref:DNA 3'-5' helicase n=1 Tax=Pseudodesulfovibrio portus TaxID=231439 RepID=A0ABN6S053_9BACT|nr:UvrD-helicase domain-containing protein [Pseudodesulfovibrio portus]BDQ35633.1 hypothetical protein JCM14722_31750 [Pseudodesulfovibrio portus]